MKLNLSPRWTASGLIALAAILRFWALGREGLWVDEAYTSGLIEELRRDRGCASGWMMPRRSSTSWRRSRRRFWADRSWRSALCRRSRESRWCSCWARSPGASTSGARS
ncbi:MAG: hypothetical protein U0527_13145 [Candidatus Eisenbacteria bacterium]